MYSKKSKNRINLPAYKLVHYLLCILLFYVSWILFRYGEFALEGVGYRYNYYVLVGYAALLLFFNRTYNTYFIGYVRARSLIFSQFLSEFFAIALVYVGVTVAWRKIYSPLVLIAMLGVQIVVNIAWSNLVTRIFVRRSKPLKTILVYRNKLDKQRFASIKGKPVENIYNIQKELQYDGSFTELEPKLKKYEAIFVAGINSRCRNGILKYCKEHGIPGYFLPHVGDVILQDAQHMQCFYSPVLYVGKKSLTPEYVIAKRAFDLIVSLLAIIILSPVLIITALAIKIYDHGPAIYKQVRLTKDGKHFKIWKFRSMRVDAEKDGVARLSSGENDDRITPIGRFVRKCRLDELPQLFNILKGDMSFVGPRPERPEIAEQYYKHMPDFKMRLQVKAGLTGYAQVYGKYNTDPYNKLELDLLYIKNMSIITDIRIMFATVEILFIPESTEGVGEGQTTAMGMSKEDSGKTRDEIHNT